MLVSLYVDAPKYLTQTTPGGRVDFASPFQRFQSMVLSLRVLGLGPGSLS